MAKNMLLIIPKLTEYELGILQHKMGNISVQELSFCNRFDVARSLGRNYDLLAVKIFPYWPLVIFARHLMRLSRFLAIGTLIVAAIMVPGFAIIAIAVHFGPWWFLLFIPYIVSLVAVFFTVTDFWLQ